LAAADDMQLASSGSRDHRLTSSHDTASIDAAHATELDRLVDAGDWVGVVLTAAKFDAANSDKGSRTGSSANSTNDSATDSATGTGTGTAGSTSLSDSPSKAQKRAEVRAEVEALVRRVVPEEIDNVDEMMNQFKGREEELVETLRTMQERAVAQKARQAGHKQAKVQARQSVQRGIVPGTGSSGMSPGAAAATGVVAGVAAGAGVAAIAGAAGKKKADSPDSAGGAQKRQSRSALEAAIEKGDWEAVGEAAAMMSDASATTASSGEIKKLANSEASESSETSSRRSGDRASELDKMISKGDWTGVVEATNKYSAADKSNPRSKEEEDALAQAELWMKIAEQKKKEGATDAGASDAAEWAIQRSLSQLKHAEKKDVIEEQDEV